MNRLKEIYENKRLEVEAVRQRLPLLEVWDRARAAAAVRPFRQALASSPNRLALIAEVKKASPSQGLIRGNFEPAKIALAYREVGADCLSVLTDEKYFQGSPENLGLARDASGLPCLRKDFIFDPYQVYESRAWGADCILLIVAGLDEVLLGELYSLGGELGMDVLVEVHSKPEVDVALRIGADLVGVNNRNLADMSTSLTVSEELLPMFGGGVVAVSESALATNADLERVRIAGARAVLIGTTFCASPDIGAKVREVMGW